MIFFLGGAQPSLGLPHPGPRRRQRRRPLLTEIVNTPLVMKLDFSSSKVK